MKFEDKIVIFLVFFFLILLLFIADLVWNRIRERLDSVEFVIRN